MVTRAEPGSQPRLPLSRERVLRAAITIADSSGIESLTMRRLAEELGAEAMSLYYYLANKEDLLDGIADDVVDLGHDGVRDAVKEIVRVGQVVVERHRLGAEFFRQTAHRE